MTTGPPDGKCANPAGGPGGMPLALRLNEGLGSTEQGKEEDRDIAKHAMTLLEKRAGCGVLTRAADLFGRGPRETARVSRLCRVVAVQFTPKGAVAAGEAHGGCLCCLTCSRAAIRGVARRVSAYAGTCGLRQVLVPPRNTSQILVLHPVLSSDGRS